MLKFRGVARPGLGKFYVHIYKKTVYMEGGSPFLKATFCTVFRVRVIVGEFILVLVSFT